MKLRSKWELSGFEKFVGGGGEGGGVGKGEALAYARRLRVLG